MPLLDPQTPMNALLPSAERAGRVLYVDDDCLFRDLVKRRLERRCRCEVRAIDDDANTLKQAEEFRPDAIVLDARLSQRSGIDLLKELRALPEMAATPALFYTACEPSWFCDTVRDLHVTAVISKLDLPQLDVEVHALLNAARCEAARGCLGNERGDLMGAKPLMP